MMRWHRSDRGHSRPGVSRIARCLGVLCAVAALAAPVAGPAGPAVATVAPTPTAAAPDVPDVPDVVATTAPEDIGAAGAVLWDPEADRVLWGRDARVGRPMASTTKIMTSLLAVEAGTLDEVVTVSAAAAALGRVPGGATLGLREGEQIPMGDLLSGLLLRSGNDAALAVAEHVAGTEEAFVAAMNDRAEALGLTETNFLNASGLTDDPDHRASPLDLARLAEVALDEPAIAERVEAEALTNPTFGVMDNRNELLGTFRGADGVKTGFTSLAGPCLVASATRDGRRLVSVVLDSPAYFAESAAILEYGFTAWRRPALAEGQQVALLRTSAGATGIAPAERVAVTVPAGTEVGSRISWEPAVGPTPGAGEVVGTLTLEVDSEPQVDTELVTTAAIGRAPDPPGGVAVGNAVEDALRDLVRLERRTVPLP